MPPKKSKKKTLDALPDVPDYRDRWYEPTLAPLAPAVARPKTAHVLDQGTEGACTGFGLAAVINLLHERQGRDVRVSARMLYEMAKRHDEWKGHGYEGSSCRGAIKGWYHMGVCRESLWPSSAKDGATLTLARAKDARSHTIGAYYRVRKNIVDMHAAINETGAVYASADVHPGWMDPKKGRIEYSKTREGGHAFAIVGYDDDGFWVQNSWGEDWGRKGMAVWTYEDWADNVGDAWVVQLALPTPQLYSRRTTAKKGGGAASSAAAAARKPRRDEIAGHFVHVDDGQFADTGRYWSTLDDVRQTAALVAKSDKYQHLMIYAHGGLNSTEASARRIAAMRDTFKANGIYPFHFMYDTGLMEELKDIVLGKRSEAEGRAGGITDWTDRIIERATRIPGRALWREMKADAARAFERRTSPGTKTLEAFLDAFTSPGAVPKKLHLVGHSTGGILHARLLQALAKTKRKLRIASVNLLAPATSIALYEEAFAPHLRAGPFGVDLMQVFNLTDDLEKDDTVGGVYRKSLLYLVARAFEEVVDPPTPLLGLQRDARGLGRTSTRLVFHNSNGRGRKTSPTKSTTHGGFDNDPNTMNTVLKTILGRARVRKPFTAASLDY